jgi:hypothetical protein
MPNSHLPRSGEHAPSPRVLRLRQLHRELQDRQQRLGTPAEQPGDFDHTLHLAHEINNVFTAEFLGQLDPAAAPRPFLAVLREFLHEPVSNAAPAT